MGIVIASAPNQQWTVFWIQIGHCSTHSYNVLKYEGNCSQNEFDNFNKETIDVIILQKNLVNQVGIDRYLTSQLPPVASPSPTQEEVVIVTPLQVQDSPGFSPTALGNVIEQGKE